MDSDSCGATLIVRTSLHTSPLLLHLLSSLYLLTFDLRLVLLVS